MTLAEIAALVGAPPPPGAGAVTVSSVEFDSRRVTPGALYVALPGERVDGHDFAGAAAEAGAVAVLGLHAVPDLPTLVIPAPKAGDGGHVTAGVLPAAMPLLGALSTLAGHVAARLVAGGLTVIGVTGSAGKTSTKDLIAAVLDGTGSVVAPPESFNNELGHPYTVLRADPDTDFLVVEMSARGAGHIAKLAATARPRIAAVLNVGSAHLGEFGSREAIARAKGELVEALPAAADGGVAVLNADDPLVSAMSSRTAAAVVRFGTGAGAAVRAQDITLNRLAQAVFTLVTPEGSAPVRLRLVGTHHVSNALAAAAVARAAGVDVHAVAERLSAAEPASKWRMAVSEIGGGITLINDAYNANPESVRAALDAMTTLAAGRRTWAVLGEMAELGSIAPRAHVEIGRAAAAAGARVIAVGQAARGIDEGARAEATDRAARGGHDDAQAGQAGEVANDAVSQWVPDTDAALRILLSSLRPADVVLVKASRSVGLERFAQALTDAVGAMRSAPGGGSPAGQRTGREST